METYKIINESFLWKILKVLKNKYSVHVYLCYKVQIINSILTSFNLFLFALSLEFVLLIINAVKSVFQILKYF